MRFRTTAILVGILVVIGGYVLLFERDSAESVDETPRPLLLDFSTNEARELRVSRPAAGQRTELVYRPTEGAWYVTYPREEPADAYEVERLLATLAGLQSVRELTGPLEPLSGYGLSPPEMQVSVTLETGRQIGLDVGLQTVTSGGYYAKVAGEDVVHVISSYVAQDLDDLLSSPPYRPTATPEPTPTPEPTIAPEPTS